MIEAAARRLTVRGLWVGAKKAATELFSRWVWARSLCTEFAILMLQAAWKDYVNHRVVGDHCQADRIFQLIERVNEWLGSWSWLDWKEPSNQAWLSKPKVESWADLAQAEPIEQQKLPDIEVEFTERDLDGKVHAVRRKPVLADAWIEDVPAYQHGGMTFHLYDGPSLADKLTKDGSLRPKRRTTEKQEECEVVNVMRGVNENAQFDIDVSGGQHVDLAGLYIGTGVAEGEVTLVAHENEGVNYWISFKAESAKELGRNIVLAAEKVGA